MKKRSDNRKVFSSAQIAISTGASGGGINF